MTATIDKDIPSFACQVWHDGANLYLRLPDSGYITKLPFCEAGLSKGLKLIRAKAAMPTGYVTGQSNLPTNRRKPADRFDEGTRSAARDILRRAGK